jgi:hypothetical protein
VAAAAVNPIDRRTEGKRRKVEENSLKVFLERGGKKMEEGRRYIFFRRGSGDRRD